MRLLLVLLLAVGCSSSAYVRARHEGISLEAGAQKGGKGSTAPPTAACDDQLRVIVARLRYFCTPPAPAVCLEVAALDAWVQGVRCYFRDP